MPQRYPIFDGDKKLQGFTFKQHIELLPHPRWRDRYKFIQSLNDYIKQRYENDHDHFRCFNINYVLSHLPLDKRKQTAFYSEQAIFDLKYDKTFNEMIYHPKKFQPQLLHEKFAKKYKKQADGTYFYEKEFEMIEDKFQKADSFLVETVSDEKGAEQLLRLIKSIPQLKFKLTIEQEKMISTPNNLLCLGRSGTGKTTSSALRLFSTDVFFKYMDNLRKFKADNPDKLNQHFQVDPYFLNKPTSLKLVFVTFSPVLTNEVKKFYEDTKQHFIQQLIIRREKLLKKEMMMQEERKDYEVIDDYSENEEEEILGGDSTQADQNDLHTYLKLEQDIFQDEDQLEKQLKLPSSMDSLSADHFPLFATVRRLIYMIDASLQSSFFSRNSEGGIVGMDSGVEWHNENRGVFMINQYFKSQHSYDEKIKKLGAKLMKLDEELEIDDLVDIDDHQLDDYYDQQNVKAQENMASFNVSGGLANQIGNNDGYMAQCNLTGRTLSFEVDFETFKNRFWPKVANWTKLTPLVVWTEIFSVIKGGAQSHCFENQVYPFILYIGDGARSTRKLDAAKFLTLQEKVMIYQIFMHYEKWKDSMMAYDFNDVVNHIIVQTKQGLRPQQQIHFLMVDEVQDLTPNILFLLTSITEKNIFFCGDTAQTIAKGVGFRFYNLKTVFQSTQYFSAPSVLQLVKNFRSHSRILDLANSVVSLIELIFPKTIDKLMKESSDMDGPKPIFIDPAQSDEQLESLLFSKSFASQSSESVGNGPQFGCNQVIIVRDQESKHNLPEFLKSMLCLTVYEAKGLEFDDVILFNFFEDSKCGNQWILMKDIDYSQRVIKKLFKDFDFLNFDKLDIEEKEALEDTNFDPEERNKIKTFIINDDEEIETELILKRERGQVYRQYAQLCTELKFLYVAITRPKKVLIIYDSDNSLRKPLQDFWARQGLISVVNKEMLFNHSIIPQEVQQTLRSGISSKKATEDEWKIQGILLFKKKFYHSAIQCFKNANDKDLEIRCIAYQHADKAQALLGEVESKQVQSRNKIYKKSERNQMKREIKDMKNDANKELELAGSYFEQIGMHRHAAQCFCSAQKLDRAAAMFESLVNYGQSAECYLKTGNYRKAADFYAKAGLFANAFECYERLQDWEGLLLCLSQNKLFFKKEERESLIEKYFPIALNQLYHIYSQLDPSLQGIGMDEENKGKLQEMRIKLKFMKSISIIREDQQEYEESDSEEEEKGIEQELQDQENQIENSDQEIKPMLTTQFKEETKQLEESQSFEIIDTTTNKGNLNETESIYIIDDENDENKQQLQNEVENEQEEQKIDGEIQKIDLDSQNNQFEVLSCLDPDDEFLQSGRSVSLIESLVSKASDSFSVISSHSSAYSLIGKSKIHSLVMSIYSEQTSMAVEQMRHSKVQDRADQTLDLISNISSISGQNSAISLMNQSRFSAIENERDTYAEDIVMQKIIYYVSLFSDDVKSRLNEMRSKDTLGHLQIQQDPNDGFDNQFMYIDLDDISQELLHLILDTLEHYELFRLCLIICNRYQLKDKVARYLISIGNKYSNLKNFKQNFFTKLKKNNDVKAQQIYSVIAHEAIHNVLQLVEKDFLKLDEQGKDTINIKDNCFDNLFIQGFWRKLVFLMDTESSLQLCKSMGDRESFKLLYLIYRCSIKDPILIRSALSGSSYEFEQYIKQDVNQQTQILAGEVLVQDEIETFREIFSNYCNKKTVYQDNSEQTSMNNYLSRQRQLISIKSQDDVRIKKGNYLYIKRIVALLYSLAQQFQQGQHQNLSFFLYSINKKSMSEIMLLIIRTLKILIYNKPFIELENKKNHYKKQDSLYKISEEIKRVILLPYKVYLLDGLEIFEKLSDQYCIVHSSSSILKQIQDKHSDTFDFFKNGAYFEIYKKLREQYQQIHLINSMKQAIEKIEKSFDNNTDLKKLNLPFPCDLNGFEYFLVPKQWVFDIVFVNSVCFVKFLLKNSETQQFTQQEKIKRVSIMKRLQKLAKSNLNNIQSGYLERQNVVNRIQLLVIPICRQFFKVIHDDKIPGLIEQTISQIQTMIEEVNDSILERNKAIISKYQYITRLPHNIIIKTKNLKEKSDPEETFNKNQIISFAFQSLREAFGGVNKKDKFYTKALNAFKMFALADEYILMMEYLRGRKKRALRSEKNIIAKNNILNGIKHVYDLLDAHVYIKNNLWVQGVNYIYSFLNSCFDHLKFTQIIYLIEGGFYRSLFSYYIFRNKMKDGVLIPDYAMHHIEPESNYQCQPLNQTKSLFEILNIEYFEIKIEKANDIKMINEALYWCEILLKVLNQDIEQLLYESIYHRVYNIMISLMVNITSKELQQEQKLQEYIIDIASGLLNSSIDKRFPECRAMLQYKRIHEYLENQVHTTSDKRLFTLLKFKQEKNIKIKEHGGFVRLTKGMEYDKEIQTQLNKQMDKAYYVEMSIMAKHYAAANYICRIYREIKQKRTLNKQLEGEKQESEVKKVFTNQYSQYLQVVDKFSKGLRRVYIDEVKENIVATLDSFGSLKRQLIQLSVSKIVHNSLDLHYLKKQIDLLHNRQLELTRAMKLAFTSHNNVEIMMKVSNLCVGFKEFIAVETKSIADWVTQKAEPNIIELEKKQLNIRNKWETLVQFQKRKRTLLKHLTRKNKL
ncbi:lupus brain antigen [Stylonychia lemnae]|uniref:Lupus brain antigen n=1 Tax=Stylonychia lemnae TaxID=5949 RepID=A0A078BAF5_STYLE|nr:lupus brain antigen [Stylonychia lemnae]|eukprot:CDW90518.1 lupus brain antigen [Stylonychia lemnae]